jgi:chemotaxis protein methyltransferase CheR
MDQQLFQRFASLAYDKAGISIRPGKEALVAARVAKRQRALSIADPQGYLRYLEEDTSGEELSLFLDVISTHFTSFFREPDHFDLLAAEVSRLAAAGQQRIRLWSAASSTGEEPYTMAMTALGVPGADRLDLRILATDIAVDTLKKAQAGVYAADRIEPVPPPLRARWFTRRGDAKHPEGELYEVKDELKRLVVFRRLNLTSPPYPMSGPLDIVFCRNVLIYFDQPTRQKLISAVERLIAPGGLLCLGHTETLSGIRCNLKLVRPSVFRRPVTEGAEP